MFVFVFAYLTPSALWGVPLPFFYLLCTALTIVYADVVHPFFFFVACEPQPHSLVERAEGAWEYFGLVGVVYMSKHVVFAVLHSIELVSHLDFCCITSVLLLCKRPKCCLVTNFPL